MRTVAYVYMSAEISFLAAVFSLGGPSRVQRTKLAITAISRIVRRGGCSYVSEIIVCDSIRGRIESGSGGSGPTRRDVVGEIAREIMYRKREMRAAHHFKRQFRGREGSKYCAHYIAGGIFP